jgi:FkbM family methyltransferase
MIKQKLLAKEYLRSFFHLLGLDIKRTGSQGSFELLFSSILTTGLVDVVIDIGANIGQFYRSVRGGGYEGLILSVEPLRAANNELLKIAATDSKLVVVRPLALSNFDGRASFLRSVNLVSSSFLEATSLHVAAASGAAAVATEEVEVARFDTLINDSRLDFNFAYLKIDAQGAERSILDGVIPLKRRVGYIQLEVSLSEMYGGESLFFEIYSMLHSHGYRLIGIFPIFSDVRTREVLQCEAVFKNDELFTANH